jgi:hypothetical protein
MGGHSVVTVKPGFSDFRKATISSNFEKEMYHVRRAPHTFCLLGMPF